MKLRLAFLFALCAASTCSALLWIVPSRFSATSSPASATDTFNRDEDANPMSTTASDGTSTWTSGPGAAPDCKIMSNQLRSTGDYSIASIATPVFAANQYAEITMPSTGLVQYAGPMVRVQSSSDCSGYVVVATSTTSLLVGRIVNGSLGYPTGIGAEISGLAAMGANTRIGISASGSTITAYIDGASVGTRTDSTHASGQPGVYFYSSGYDTAEAFAANDL